jgi:cysteine desulfurase / selenocysteine lyase
MTLCLSCSSFLHLKPKRNNKSIGNLYFSSKFSDAIRKDFPLLNTGDDGLVYLDNAATSQKPFSVLREMDIFYHSKYSNVHRSGHRLGRGATEAFENARRLVAKFIGATCSEEVVFTSGATDSINLVANTWGVDNLKQGDDIILSVAEHHSNILPWQMLAQKTGCSIKYVGLNHMGMFDMDQFKTLITSQTKLVALGHISNVLGAVNPIREVRWPLSSIL